MMTLDEAIKHYKEVATELEEEAVKYCCDDTEIMNKYYEYVDEHRQLAEWLRELVQLRKFTHFVANHVMADDFEDDGSFYAEVFCRKLNKLGVIRHEDNNWVYDDEVKTDGDSD